MGEPLLNSLLVSVVGAVLTAAFVVLSNINKQQKEELKAMRNAIAELNKNMAIVNAQMSPLWARVQAQIVADLHHPDPRYHEMDALLEKLEAGKLADSDRDRLEVLLLERSIDLHRDITPEQRAAAAYMITVMRKVLVERAEATAAESGVGSVAMIEGATKAE
jgi:hypothetical protein